jgi:quercetin dioxygenase-like cupin family protein
MSQTMPSHVTELEVKNFDSPDERRRPPRAEIDVVTVSHQTVGRFTFQPGWRWSDSIKPIVGTDTCQVTHVGYCLAGTLEVQMASGEKASVTAGDTYTIPPGHDAWVPGDETFVGLEFMSAAQFGTHTS